MNLLILLLFIVTGSFIINLRKTWEKLLLAARIIVAVENPADVCVISSRPYGQVSSLADLSIGQGLFTDDLP